MGEQQFAVALGVVVVVGAHFVFGDVHADNKQLVALEGTVRVGKTGFAGTYRLDFGACQGNASGKSLFKKVLESGAFVLNSDVVVPFFHNGRKNTQNSLFLPP